jgi:hypothetical protein
VTPEKFDELYELRQEIRVYECDVYKVWKAQKR